VSRPRPQSTAELRETVRQQLLASIGGWSGALIAAIPTVVFVIVNVSTSLWPAIYASVGAALVLTVYRFARKQSVQQSLSGLLGVVVAALIAARTGQARGYFLFGIITSFLYAVPFLASLPFRRPLVGLFWEFLDPTPVRDPDRPWYRRRPLLVAYFWSTVVAAVLFLMRGIVQLILYRHNATGWLAFARIAMGYPLFVLAVLLIFFLVRRARKQVVATDGPVEVEDSSDGSVEESGVHRQDGTA
jgi:hypothetical protein